TRNGHRLIAVILGAWSGGVRTQQAAQLLERGFNSTELSWLTPSLGTVNELAPVEAQPPNLRDEMCGGHRRKPPSEDNDEEGEGGENAATGDAPGNGQGFMLSSLAKGKFVLGPPVDTEPPVVVFTGPARRSRPRRRSAPRSSTPPRRRPAAKPSRPPRPKPKSPSPPSRRRPRPRPSRRRPSRRPARSHNDRRGRRARVPARAGRADPAHRPHRLPRRRQDNAAQPAPEGPGARRHRRHYQRVRRGLA